MNMTGGLGSEFVLNGLKTVFEDCGESEGC